MQQCTAEFDSDVTEDVLVQMYLASCFIRDAARFKGPRHAIAQWTVAVQRVCELMNELAVARSTKPVTRPSDRVTRTGEPRSAIQVNLHELNSVLTHLANLCLSKRFLDTIEFDADAIAQIVENGGEW